MVGKYVDLTESYKSLSEALVHGGIANQVKVNFKWVDAEAFDLGAEPPQQLLVVRGGEGREPECAAEPIRLVEHRHPVSSLGGDARDFEPARPGTELADRLGIRTDVGDPIGRG